MKKLLGLILFCAIARGSGVGNGNVLIPGVPTLSTPMTRQIFQRNSSNIGSVSISGTGTGTFTAVQASTTVTNGGTAVPWTTIYTGSGPSFSGILPVGPGQYSLLVRLMRGGIGGGPATIAKVGVGEIFLVAGQSLVANWGNNINTPTDDRVSNVTYAGAWAFAQDPQPNCDGTGGSPIPAMGSALASYLNMPIGIMSIAIGGTSSAQWVGTGSPNYFVGNFEPALTLLGTNFRAVIWEQGQADGIAGVTAAQYETNIANLIAEVRTYAGWNMPWGIASASTIAADTAYPVIAGAQAFIVSNDTLVFQGSNSDSIPNSDRWDMTHFNAAGQLIHGGLWATAIETYFGW
jgi:hypothetical protein